MKAIQALRSLIVLGAALLSAPALSTTAVVDVPVGEAGGSRAVDTVAPVATEVVERVATIESPEPAAPTRATRPSSSSRTRRATAPRPAPGVMQGEIGGAEVAPLRPNLDMIQPTELMASIEGSEEPTPATPQANSSAEKPTEIALHVVDWELSEIIASITAHTGINVVLASTTNPKVTVRLDKMPVREVVRIVASLANMQVIQLRSGGLVVAPGDVLKNAFPQEYNEQIITPSVQQAAAANGAQPAGPRTPVVESVRVYDVRHVKPAELMEALKSIFEDDGLVVRVGPGKLLPSALNGSEGGSGGGDSSGGSSSGSSSGGGESSSTSTGRTLILRGSRDTVQAAIELAEKLDVKQPQVAIRVQIHDISNEALRDLGVAWQETTGTTIRENNTTQNDINFGSFTRSALTFQATLRHLEKTEKAKILAQPNISVLDQEPGYILIGDRINYPVVTSLNGSGQPVFDVREERVGIYLQVSATVNDASRVTLNLYPQVSAVSGFLEVPGQGSYPQISTREAKTSLRVKSGETVIIGGLLRDEEIKAVERVPILSSIPLFGELFTRRKTTRNQSQVIISITPQIIQTEQ